MGGAVSLAVGLAKAHSQLRRETIFVGHDVAANGVSRTLPAIRLQSNSSVGRIWEARSVVRRLSNRQDVVLALDNFPLLSGRREIVVVHNALLLFGTSMSPARHVAWRLTRNRAVAYVAPTEWMAREMRRQGFKHVRAVPHGGLLERPVRQAAQPKDGRITVIGLGVPSPQKNFGSIVAACGIAKCKPNLRLTVDPNSPEGDTLRRQAEYAGLPAGRLDLVGMLAKSEVAATLADSHVLVFPSTIESFGLPLVEAMQVGLPVVASDTPWAREVCGSGASYASPRDPEEIAACIDLLFGDTEEWSKASNQALERGSMYRWIDTARRYGSIIGAVACLD